MDAHKHPPQAGTFRLAGPSQRADQAVGEAGVPAAPGLVEAGVPAVSALGEAGAGAGPGLGKVAVPVVPGLGEAGAPGGPGLTKAAVSAVPGPSEAGIPADAGLDEAVAPADPVELFSVWLAEAVAAGLPEPNAMVLSTVSGEGRPRSRSMLLKSHGPDGFVFYTNRTSRKGSDLAANPWASLLFPWYALRRQVIVQGWVMQLTQEESEPYFHSRPYGSQIGAWASKQSSVIASRDVLDDRYARLAQRWPEGTTVPMPDFWGGYRVVPATVEFWRGRVNRLHDRLHYRRGGTDWVVERLSP